MAARRRGTRAVRTRGRSARLDIAVVVLEIELYNDSTSIWKQRVVGVTRRRESQRRGVRFPCLAFDRSSGSFARQRSHSRAGQFPFFGFAVPANFL
jgi:hypothetical protein